MLGDRGNDSDGSDTFLLSAASPSLFFHGAAFVIDSGVGEVISLTTGGERTADGSCTGFLPVDGAGGVTGSLLSPKNKDAELSDDALGDSGEVLSVGVRPHGGDSG